MKEVWEKQYEEKKPPWNYDRFDKDLSEFFRCRFFDNKKFSVIDLGCGNGSQAHYIENQFGNERNIFNVYDIIIDRGLIHNLFHLKDKRHKYFEMIGNIIHDESYIVLKVMSPYEARFNPTTHSGPYRFNEKQLMEFFSGFGFKCIQLKDTFFYSNIEPHLRGYFSIYKKEGDVNV